MSNLRRYKSRSGRREEDFDPRVEDGCRVQVNGGVNAVLLEAGRNDAVPGIRGRRAMDMPTCVDTPGSWGMTTRIQSWRDCPANNTGDVAP